MIILDPSKRKSRSLYFGIFFMTKVKIPYTCLLRLVEKPQLLKAFCIYGKLKLIGGRKGLIYNYKSCKQTLADTLCISQNTLRKYVGILKSEGFVWESKNNLRIGNSFKIFAALELEPHVCDNVNSTKKYNTFTTRQIRLEFNDLNPERIFAEAILFKKNQIIYKQKENIKNVLLQEIGPIYCNNIKKKMNKDINLKTTSIYDSLSETPSYNFLNTDKKYGFLDNNMCLQTCAHMLGRKSKSTGYRHLNKLQDLNYLEMTSRTLVIANRNETNSLGHLRAIYGDKVLVNKDYYFIKVPNIIDMKIELSIEVGTKPKANKPKEVLEDKLKELSGEKPFNLSDYYDANGDRLYFSKYGRGVAFWEDNYGTMGNTKKQFIEDKEIRRKLQ